MDAASMVKKLNLRAPERAAIVGAPDPFAPVIAFLRSEVGTQVDEAFRPGRAYDYVHAFVTRQADAMVVLPHAADAVAAGGALWISYPKRSSKRYASDLSRDGDGWDPLYDRDFEPVSQVAIDDDWSALRFRPVKEIASFRRGFAGSQAGKKRLADG